MKKSDRLRRKRQHGSKKNPFYRKQPEKTITHLRDTPSPGGNGWSDGDNVSVWPSPPSTVLQSKHSIWSFYSGMMLYPVCGYTDNTDSNGTRNI